MSTDRERKEHSTYICLKCYDEDRYTEVEELREETEKHAKKDKRVPYKVIWTTYYKCPVHGTVENSYTDRNVCLLAYWKTTLEKYVERYGAHVDRARKFLDSYEEYVSRPIKRW